MLLIHYHGVLHAHFGTKIDGSKVWAYKLTCVNEFTCSIINDVFYFDWSNDKVDVGENILFFFDFRIMIFTVLRAIYKN